MSWTDIRPYFRDRCNEQGLEEWPDGFNFQNIPSSIIDGAYHVEFGEISGEGLNQNDQESLVQVIVRVFRKGFLNTQDAIDQSIALGQTLVKETCRPTNRLNESFKNVEFLRMQPLVLADSNDNSIMLEIEFNVRDSLDVLN